MASAACLRRGVEHVRLLRIHDEIDDAELVVDEETIASTFCRRPHLEDAALLVGRVEMPHHPDVHNVRIGCGSRRARCGASRGAHRPRLAGIYRLVDAVAAERAAALRVSPVPTQTTLEFEGAMATAPIVSLF